MAINVPADISSGQLVPDSLWNNDRPTVTVRIDAEFVIISGYR